MKKKKAQHVYLFITYLSYQAKTASGKEHHQYSHSPYRKAEILVLTGSWVMRFEHISTLSARRAGPSSKVLLGPVWQSTHSACGPDPGCPRWGRIQQPPLPKHILGTLHFEVVICYLLSISAPRILFISPCAMHYFTELFLSSSWELISHSKPAYDSS